MTIFISVIGFIGRFAAALLATALGWASSLMFGRVQRSHQMYVLLMLAGSLLWLCCIVGASLPGVTGFLYDSTPKPGFVDRTWLQVVLLAGIAVLPLGVGLAAYLVPSGDDRPTSFGIPLELARGYLLTPILCALLLFLPAVGISRKARSVRHRWSDTHIPIVVKPKGYDRLVTDLQAALAAADLPLEAEDAPRILSLPAWILTRVAGGNVRKLRPDRLVELEGPNLRIGVYPSDIAISGPSPEREMARTAVLSRLATTAAWLTTSAESQAIEDRLAALSERLAAEVAITPAEVAVEFAGIDDAMVDLAVPEDEWDILYRVRLQVERDILGGESRRRTVAPSEAVAEVETMTARPGLEVGALTGPVADRG